jgi:hypothetical protein
LKAKGLGGLGAAVGLEAIEAGARVASGSIQAAATIAGSTIEAMGSTLGGALQGMLTQPPVTNISVSYRDVRTGGKSNAFRRPDPMVTPAPKKGTIDSTTSIEEMLSIAVAYLSSIDMNIRNQVLAQQQATKIKSAEDRENAIESVSNQVDATKIKSEGDEDTKSNVSGLVSGALKAAGLLAVIKLATMDKSELDKLGSNLSKFGDAIGWLLIAAPFGKDLIKGLLSASGRATAVRVIVGTLGSPLTWAAAAAAATIKYGIDQPIQEAWGESKSSLDYLEKNYGMKRNIGKDSYTINGKEYKANALPPEYQTLLDAYGPLGDGRSARSRNAREEIEKHQDKYDKLKVPTQVSGESPSGKAKAAPGAYDVVFGHGKYGSPNKKLTDMTIGEVIDYQTQFKKNGAPATPMGAYQINKATLQEHGKKLYGDDYRSKKFDMQTQDELGERIYKKQGWNAWEAPRKKGIADPGSWQKAKPIIVSTETGGKAGTVDPSSPSAPTGNEYADPEKSTWDKTKMFGDFLLKLGKTDSTFKELTGSAPNYDRYKDLRTANMNAELDLIARKRQTEDSLKGGVSLPSESILRDMGGGTLDVINPNYQLAENAVIAQYISFFGYSR